MHLMKRSTHASDPSSEGPSRADTTSTLLTDDGLPDGELSTTAELLVSRLGAWRYAVEKLEKYAEALEKIYKANGKEYKRATKVLETPLKHGENWSQDAEGGIASFFEALRTTNAGVISSNENAAVRIDAEVVGPLKIMQKELKKAAHSTRDSLHKSEKTLTKSAGATQEAVEELAAHIAAFCSAVGTSAVPAKEDPFVARREVEHRMVKSTALENANHGALVAEMENVKNLEADHLRRMNAAMNALRDIVAQQADLTIAHQDSGLKALQNVQPAFEWDRFLERSADKLIDPRAPPLVAEQRTFHNMAHPSTEPLMSDFLERKSRNKLAGWHGAKYIITPAGYLHEYDEAHHEPQMSIYLPNAEVKLKEPGKKDPPAIIVKGKDTSGKLGGKMFGTSEYEFRTRTKGSAVPGAGEKTLEEWVAAMKQAAVVNRKDFSSLPSPIGDSPVVSSPVPMSPVEGGAPPAAGIDSKEYVAAAHGTDKPAGAVDSAGVSPVLTAGPSAPATPVIQEKPAAAPVSEAAGAPMPVRVSSIKK